MKRKHNDLLINNNYVIEDKFLLEKKRSKHKIYSPEIITNILILQKFFRIILNKYRLKNKTSLLGTKLKDIPLHFLVVTEKYFFDLREIYNSKVCNEKYNRNPYTQISFCYNILRYIHTAFSKYKKELVEFREKYIFHEIESISMLIAKISNIYSDNNLYFNTNNIMLYNHFHIGELFYKLYSSKLTKEFINYRIDGDILMDDNEYDYTLNLKKKYILQLIYKICSIKNEHQVTRCLLIDELGQQVLDEDTF